MLRMHLALAVLGLAVVGCGGSGGTTGEPPPLSIIVGITATSDTVEAGGSVSLTADPVGDTNHRGVTWALNGPGTLSDFTDTSVTYHAPADPLPSDTPVSIVAVSKSDSSKQSTATITVLALAVSLSASNNAVEAAGSLGIDAHVVSDPSARGVTWSLSPASGAGTLSDVTTTSVTYNAPPAPPGSDLPITITGTSVTDGSKTAQLTITVLALSVSLTVSDQIVPAGTSTVVEAHVVSDPTSRGVTWSISPASGAGTLSAETSNSVTYTAPASAPASDLPVTITGTSVADTSRAGELTLTVPQIRVKISPTSALMPRNAAQDFAASVSYDPNSAGVNWSLEQGTTPCSPTCGTVVPIDATTATFTAPAALPADPHVTLVATSATDHASAASIGITLTSGTVKLVPASLAFGRVFIQKRGVPVTKTLNTILTNTGGSALAITGMSFVDLSPATSTTPFSQTNDCGVSVDVGVSCTIGVRFRPTINGVYSATLSIVDSSTDSPQVLPLSGCLGRPCAADVQAALAMTLSASVPAPMGPSAVGTRVLDFVDPARVDPYLGNGTKREVLVRLWYPAASGAACKLAEYASPQVWMYFSQLAGVPLPEVRTNSCLDAHMAEGAYPVVVFTHGFTGTFTDYTYLFEDLASRGYVVASVDHTYEATAVSFPDGRFAQSVLGSHLADTWRTDLKTLSRALTVRLADLSFVLDELDHLNRTAGSSLANHLDLSSVAIAGHSLGGLTALKAIEHERRFRAAISLDGVVPDASFNATDQPVLLVDAGREMWADDELKLWDKLRGPRLAVNLKGAEHVTPTDEVWLARGAVQTGAMTPDKTVEAIRNYVAAFLEANLRGQPKSQLLSMPSPVYQGVEVTVQTESPCCRMH